MAKLMTGMVGVAQAASDEAKTIARSQGERFIADMDLAKQEDLEALKDLARSALEQVDALSNRVEALEAAIKKLTSK